MIILYAIVCCIHVRYTLLFCSLIYRPFYAYDENVSGLLILSRQSSERIFKKLLKKHKSIELCFSRAVIVFMNGNEDHAMRC